MANFLATPTAAEYTLTSRAARTLLFRRVSTAAETYFRRGRGTRIRHLQDVLAQGPLCTIFSWTRLRRQQKPGVGKKVARLSHGFLV